MNNFLELGLSAPVLKALTELGIEKPTKIQSESIPILLKSDRDFIGLAQTGTGKTAAFGLPLLDVLDAEWDAVQALILAPTRELAQQIAARLNDFAKYQPAIRVVCVYGGDPIVKQMKALKQKAHIVVATPGRLVDLAKRKAVKLDSITHVVLDEADEMLNMGFKEELNKILDFTPNDKTTWLFSATMPKAISNIVHQYMHDPVKVSVSSGSETNVNIAHQYVLVKATDKTEALTRLIDAEHGFFGIVFCRTKVDTEQLAVDLSQKGYAAEALNGDLTQRQRNVVMNRFKSRDVRILVATDVAARGIDVDDITHVVHHRLPDEVEFYTHRSGRTARAGKKGVSIALATKGDLKRIQNIEGKLKITVERKMVPTPSSIASDKMKGWATAIANTEVIRKPDPELWKEISECFIGIGKEELLEKLVSNELARINNATNNSDINIYDGKKATSQTTTGKMHRFFINVGSMDGVVKSDIVDLVCDVARLKKEEIGAITIQTKCSYFEVVKSKSSNVVQKFQGFQVNGRDLRVNRDDAGSEKKRTSKKGGKKRRSW